MRHLLMLLVLSSWLVVPAAASNVLTGNPLVVDTAGATVLITNYFDIVCIYWTAPTDAAHTAVVQDAAGVAKWLAKASTTTLQDEHICFPVDAPLRMQGLKVPTLGSGQLYIYLRQPMPPS